MYATPEQFVLAAGGELGSLDDQERGRLMALLKSAEAEIRKPMRFAVYDVNIDGTPRDAWVREALADATCAQARWFEETGGASGAGARFDSIRAGSTSLSRNAGSANVSSVAGDRVSPEAMSILQGAAGPAGECLFQGVRSL